MPRLEIVARFPVGAYYAQSASSFRVPEWPPHPVRLIAAFVAAAAALPDAECKAARAAIAELSACPEPPGIVAPRLVEEGADGLDAVTWFRGASQWAPRNHGLHELSDGIHPRDLGRGRAEVNKGGVALGDLPVRFSWFCDLDEPAVAALRRAAEEVTVIGTSRSPVLVSVERTAEPLDAAAAWVPDAGPGRGREVRVPTPDLPDRLDEWHARRSAPVKRNGAPASAGFIPPASLGRSVRYVLGADLEPPTPLDPEWWGEMLVVAVDRANVIRPKGPAAFAVARATRAALLAQFGEVGSTGEAPTCLHARGGDPHAAFVPLPFVGDQHADGRLLGVAVVLPSTSRLPDVALQRREVERGLRALIDRERRVTVGVPGIGDVVLAQSEAGAGGPMLALRENRWRATSAWWSTVTPVVHSRHRRNLRAESLLEQVTADCRDVGLPGPRSVEVRRTSRFVGAPAKISRRGLPAGWDGPLRGPVDHLDLEFDRPVVGPLLLGRARHFGLGLCLPTDAARH